MGFWDNLKSKASQLTGDISGSMKKFKSKSLMEGIVAGCALVTVADGAVKPEEKAKMIGFMQINDALKVFDVKEIIDAFEKYIKNFDFDYAIGKGEVLKAVRKFKNNQDEAKLLVRVCCVIGSSDGDFDEAEKKAVREICAELNLSPSEFGL